MQIDEDINWKLASNKQLKEECGRLENEFQEKQSELNKIVGTIDEINETLVEISKKYKELKSILNMREGKK